MSAQATPLPPTRSGGRPRRNPAGAAGRPAGASGDVPLEHHRRGAPDDHLCTCGRLRTDCVRDAVRVLWMD